MSMALISKIVTVCYFVRQMWESAGPAPISAVGQRLGVGTAEGWVGGPGNGRV